MLINTTVIRYKNSNLNQAQTVRQAVIDFTDRCYPFTAVEIIDYIRKSGITPAELSNKKIYRVLQSLAGTSDTVATKPIPEKNRVQIKRICWFVKTDKTYSYTWPKNVVRYNYRRPENV